MDGRRARRTGTRSGAEAGHAAADADAAGERRRTAAHDDAASSLGVDDDRDIFGDAGLGRVEDGSEPGPYARRGGGPDGEPA